MTFRGILLTKDDDGVHAAITDIDESQLPDHDVLIDVSHSTVNYKDGMAVMGRPGVVRGYPMVASTSWEPLPKATTQIGSPAR